MIQDIRYAVRQLARAWRFTAAAVLVLGLGIGTSTVFFTAVNGMVFRPERASRTGDLSIIEWRDGHWHGSELSEQEFRDLERDPPPAVAQIGGVVLTPITVVVHIPGRAERVRPEVVSGGFARVFDLQPQAGRALNSDDDRTGGPDVVMISDRLWREWFQADHRIVGTTVLGINGHPFTIVGVAPRGFRGALHTLNAAVDVWLPPTAWNHTGVEFLRPWLRRYWTTLLRPAWGVRLTDVEGMLHARLTNPPGPPEPATFFVTLTPLDEMFGATTLHKAGLIILALAGLVFVAACANLANMSLARGAQRAGEVAVRLSLGASRWRVFRLFAAETAIISASAAALGLALALAATWVLGQMYPSFRDRDFRVHVDLTPDYRVFLYAFAAGCAATLSVGIATAWHASRMQPLRGLAASGVTTGVTRRGRGMRLLLVSMQVAAAVLLLMGASLYVGMAARALDAHVRFDTSRIATGVIDLGLHGYHESSGRAFYDRLLRDVRALPGVQEAALTDGFPGGAYAATRAVQVTAIKEARNEQGELRPLPGIIRRINGSVAGVSPKFLDTIGLPLVRGRDISPADQDGAPLVAIVSQHTADLLWPGQNAIGKRLMFGNDGHWRDVIGVAADHVAASVESEVTSPANVVLIPAAQSYRASMVIVVRSSTPAAQIEPLRAAVRAIDERVALFDAATADRSMLAWAAPLNAAATLSASLGAVALAIATLGIYGAITYLITLRTREFGVRLALGARPRQLVKLVIDEAVQLLLVGLLAGVLLTTYGERLLQNRVFGFMPNEISAWVVVPLLIVGVGLLAAYAPARRASRVDPNVALREL